MHVFASGGTSFIDRAIVNELIAAIHTVIGLTCSDEAATALTTKDLRVLRDSFQDLQTIKQGASEADGLINLAFDHFSKYA